ncbi:hypothetical protein [Cyanobium sp. NIES-981]|uniref:hypothetical protein n=1 Tax=Cyanobium sp. NIES-981 TaxID=1851505 RepID=UPI0012F741A3|nr:hypothetical protein [Cyanobium sp. NIES-981]
MKTALCKQVLSGELSDVQFARAVFRYSCFPADRLREGIGRPHELILTEDQCLRLSEVELQVFCSIFLRGELSTRPSATALAELRESYLKKWNEEIENERKELQRFWIDLRRRLEQVEKDGFDVDNLSADELAKLLRRPEARESYERYRDVATIARYGWFIDLEMTIGRIRASAKTLRGLSEEHQNAPPLSLIEEIDVSAVKYFEERYSDIKTSILSRFRTRGHILEPAFAAHERGLYCLSIPVFIAQADGIFRELRGFGLFSLHKSDAPSDYREIYESILAGICDRHELAWSDFLPLLFHSKPDGGIPFNLNTKDKEGTCENYNRHAIMHGLCTFYGTKENSFRYISLLNLLRIVK